jgi:flagellar biosynthesis protein FliR
MVVVDLALGFIGKTIPQFNVMSAGLTIRSLVGMMVLVVSVGLASRVMRQELASSLELVTRGFSGVLTK